MSAYYVYMLCCRGDVYYTGLTTDIARRYRMSEGTVKSQLFRTRNELKEYLKKEGFGI